MDVVKIELSSKFERILGRTGINKELMQSVMEEMASCLSEYIIRPIRYKKGVIYSQI